MSKPISMTLAMTLVIALALSFSGVNAHAETKVNFSGDAYVRGYFVNGTGPDHTQAFNHLFRLNLDAKPDEFLTIKTGLVLAAENWEGDTHKTIATGGTAVGGTNEDGTGNGNAVHLDHAFIEYKINGWITSVGRHAVTTPGSFLSSDDRSDRIQVLKIMENQDVLALVYDKKTEGALSNNRDDLNMYSANYYGAATFFRYALQGGIWRAKTAGFGLDNVKQFTPQLVGEFLGIDYNLYYTILWGGSVLFKDDHHSAALRLTKDFEVLKVDYQSVFTKRGGLIAGGFDTLSSIINNSPDHNQSNIKLRAIGFGLGVAKKDESLHMIKLSKTLTPDLTVGLGGGYAKILTAALGTTFEEDIVVDAKAKYALSSNLNLTGVYGKFFGDNKDHAGSLTLNALF